MTSTWNQHQRNDLASKAGRRSSRVIVIAGMVMVVCGAVSAQGNDPLVTTDPAPSDAQIRFFETRIRPLLADHCFPCHGPDKQKGNLRLDSRNALLTGGDLGAAVTRDDLERSLLLKAVGYQDESLQMPPKGKLTDRQLEDLRVWVMAGAYYPADEGTRESGGASRHVKDGEMHWSFQRLGKPSIPETIDRTWPQSPIDQFVLALLEDHQLRPALPADKRTLIRRVTYDLLGLPPSPEEIEDFLDDRSPDAFSRLGDRLLASPHYGERWGRHWLDIVRYADSNGLDENVALGNAWRYRDYVVSAFNQDKPYDQFLHEQLAGDLLPAVDDIAARHERLVATGFLSLGPKVLAEVDERKMEMDIIDEQLDTFGRAVLGLTLGCARCHDHKFDPIGTDDYYALAGIFKSTRTMEHFKKVARWHENELATDADLVQQTLHAQRIAEKKHAIEDLIQRANQQLQETAPDKILPKEPEAHYSAETMAALKRLRDELGEVERQSPQLPTALGVCDGHVTDLAIHIRGNHLTLGKTVPRGFPKILTWASIGPMSATQSGRLELAQWLTDADHPLTSRVIVNRLWRWHFGQGLVRSPDNFGKLGDPPTHPELLDWLARRLMESHWSIKSMHRQLLSTSAYQMSSAHHSNAVVVDPTNRWLWRFDVRRLEAEEICDALQMVSGDLDLTMGGPVLHVPNRSYLFDHTSKDLTKYDSPRRALYLPVIRNNLYDVFQLFDAPDASVLNGDRTSTTVPPQALFMLNSDLVAQSSERLVDNLLSSSATTDAQRLTDLYTRLYSRVPADQELTRLESLLNQFEQATAKTDSGHCRRQAWVRLCHIVLASNEFLYLN